MGMICLIAVRSWTMWTRGLVAATRLHKGMIGRILHARSAFFDANPTGRILNRFSRDLNLVDSQLVQQMDSALSISIIVFGSLVASCAISPLFVVGFGPVLYLYNRAFQ